MNETRLWVAELLSQFSGQQNTLTIPRAYIDIAGGVTNALLLSQIVYWSDRTKNEDGWFAKSYPEWQEELSLSEYQVRTATKALADLGVETKLKKFDGAPTVHYRINKAIFSESILKFFKYPSSSNSSIQSVKTSDSLTEPTTEPTTEKRERDTPKKSKELPPHLKALEAGLDTSKQIWLDTFRNAHQVKPLALQGRERTDALEQVEGLIEMGCTPDDLSDYVKEREAKGKSTVWRFVVSEIHTYMARKQAGAVSDAALRDTAEQLGATAYYDTATDTTNRWDIATQRWIYEQGNTL